MSASKWLLRLLFVSLLLTTCCLKEPIFRRVPYPPAATIHLHADTRFAPYERAYLKQATDNLAVQTDGLVNAVITYDLDLQDAEGLKLHDSDDLLLRVVSDSTMPSQWSDDHPGETLLGLTIYPRDDSRGTLVYLVADQLDSGPLFVSVAMHELLHAVGLPHVSDESALMAPGLPLGEPPTCLHYADVMALCKVYGCNVQRVGYCGRGP